MYDAGADVVYHAAGASGSGVFEAAVEAGPGNWAIGVDSDQYLTAPAAQQKQILTSMLKRVDVATFDMIKSVADGSPLTSYQTYDLKKDGVGYSTSGGFVDDIKSRDRRLRRQDPFGRDQGADRTLILTERSREHRRQVHHQGPGPDGSVWPRAHPCPDQENVDVVRGG